MKFLITRLLLLLFLLSSFLTLEAQNKDEILHEAYLLYYSEKASWNGTDLFLDMFPEKRNSIGGYLSYSENNLHHCIFFDQSQSPQLMAKFSFNDQFDLQTVKIDTTKRDLTQLENNLHAIRNIALENINSDRDFYPTFQNTNLNLIPIIDGKSKKVVILTGPTNNGVVVIGNDFELIFNKKNKLKSRRAIHNNPLFLEHVDATEIKQTGSIHSHLESTGDLITSTDICTLMLYGPYTSWEQHYVISPKYVSIWSFKTNELLVITRKAWDKISENESKEE